MCGILGILSASPVYDDLYRGLLALQNRGQNACGMAIADEQLVVYKKTGLVQDVFAKKKRYCPKGFYGIAHCRYATSCDPMAERDAQPFAVYSPFAIAFAHNGHIRNVHQTRKSATDADALHTDSEMLLQIFMEELQLCGVSIAHITPDLLFTIVRSLSARVQGSYSVVLLIAQKGLLVFRDCHGIRPLVMGTRSNACGGVDYCFASESTALAVTKFSVLRDVQPGETIFVTVEGQIFCEVNNENAPFTPCAFEYLYTARTEAVMNGARVYDVRMLLSDFLARTIQGVIDRSAIDCVVAIPHSGSLYAQEVARQLQLPYEEGFVTDPSMSRTFMMPYQSMRESAVTAKLHAIRSRVASRSILLVDDSIVRGTTARQAVHLLRQCGAERIFFASASPPIRYVSRYGINLRTTEELLAAGRTVADIEKILQVDRLVYQDLADCKSAILAKLTHCDRLELSCFDGQYIV